MLHYFNGIDFRFFRTFECLKMPTSIVDDIIGVLLKKLSVFTN